MLGEWAGEDYSVACMHAVDYRVVGGYNLSAVNFQFDLYQRHVAAGLQVNKVITRISLLIKTRAQSNLTKSASRGAHSPVRGHPRGSKVVPLNSWGRVSY